MDKEETHPGLFFFYWSSLASTKWTVDRPNNLDELLPKQDHNTRSHRHGPNGTDQSHPRWDLWRKGGCGWRLCGMHFQPSLWVPCFSNWMPIPQTWQLRPLFARGSGVACPSGVDRGDIVPGLLHNEVYGFTPSIHNIFTTKMPAFGSIGLVVAEQYVSICTPYYTLSYTLGPCSHTHPCTHHDSTRGHELMRCLAEAHTIAPQPPTPPSAQTATRALFGS